MKFFRLYFHLCVIGTLLFFAEAHADCLKNPQPLFEQGRDYFLRGQYLLATQQFSEFTLLSCDTEQSNMGRVRWAQSLFELGEFDEGDRVIQKIQSNALVANQARVVRAWYQPTLRSILTPSERDRFEAFDKKIDAFPKIKNPWLAGGLSAVLPGLGQAYNGNYQSAVFSFILNALFLSATLELHRHHLGATAIASGTVFSILYVGNIVGSAQSSSTLNEQYSTPLKSELKTTLFPELSF